MRIGIMIFSLCHLKGGGERFAVDVATGLTERGHKCTLLYADKEGSYPSYVLSKNIKTINLSSFNPCKAWLENAKRLLSAEQLDVILVCNSSCVGSVYISMCKGLHIPIVWSERSSPQIIETERWNRAERIACMSASDAIVLLCKSFFASIPISLRQRTMIIPNFTYLSPNNVQKHQRNRKLILTVARLDESTKQISLLIRALALLKQVFPDWHCRICGDGISKRFYEKLITDMGINDYVSLVGNVDDIATEYAAADIFVFPSRHEGFPHALIEAQRFGLPAVGFAACPGVNEIIVDGKTGILVQQMTVESLAKGMRTLMDDEALRRNMGKQACELSSQYSAERILDKWEKLFKDVIICSKFVRLDCIETINDFETRIILRNILENPFKMIRKEANSLCKSLRINVQQDILHKRVYQYE